MSKVWVVVSAASLCVAMAGCSSDSSSSSSGGSGSTTGSSGSGSGGSTGQSLYDKYGGDAGVWDVVNTAATGLLADPNEAPYFGVVVANGANGGGATGKGANGHDDLGRLASCLQYQLSLAMGAPGGLSAYPPAVADPRGYACERMSVIHSGVGVPSGTFDIFVLDAASVLAAKGVSADDVQTIGGVLNSLRGDIVAAQPVFYSCADGGLVDGASVPANFDGGCLP